MKALLESLGYFALRELPDGRWIGLQQMLFTCGLFVDLNENGYDHRYCYATVADALAAVGTWDGAGDPPGPWIKRKGRGERSNPATFKGIPVGLEGD